MSHHPVIELDAASPQAVDGRQLRAVSFQRVRMTYAEDVIERFQVPRGGRALVVGSGRGLLARGLARLGLAVTAADPSPRATALARQAGDQEGLSIEYVTAPAESLAALGDGDYDLAYYADTFEITRSLDDVLAEAARLLRPGAPLIFDTVNRTPLSRLVYLGAFQALPMTRIMPPGRYAADRLRPPAELAAAMRRHGLLPQDVCGFKPRSAGALVRATLARRRGRIGDEEIARMVSFVLDPHGRPVVTYLGHARRA
ncbi:class I SAM-dependent methyltransferase [Nonomuraea sp. NPDC050783]|uniref:class I SAM-dependent methyltransferase n=1 Tax=Nonomuraea sp. NPDC050783 TaxID=3154634 RepID=UPI0034664FA4